MTDPIRPPELTAEQAATLDAANRAAGALFHELADHCQRHIAAVWRAIRPTLATLEHAFAAMDRPRPPRRPAPHLSRPAPMPHAHGYHHRQRRRR